MILVTGGTGLIGAHLLYALAEKRVPVRAIKRKNSSLEQVKKVFCYYRKEYSSLFNQIDWVEVDIFDLFSLSQAFSGIDYVYHCAGKVSFHKSQKNSLKQTNVLGTTHIVNLCLAHTIKKLCYVSSVAVLEEAGKDGIITEHSAWYSNKSKSVYALSKYNAEMEVWRGISEGLQAVIVNPTVVLGPGDYTRSSGQLIVQAAKGLPFYTPGIMGFVAVRDVVNLMVQLMESDITGERFILNGENLPYKELFKLVSSETGKKPPSVLLPKTFAHLAVIFENIVSFMLRKEPSLSRKAIQSAYAQKYYSAEKVKQATGYSFIPIEQTVKEVMREYMKS